MVGIFKYLLGMCHYESLGLSHFIASKRLDHWIRKRGIKGKKANEIMWPDGYTSFERYKGFLFLFVWWLSEGPEGLHSFCFGVVREVKTIKHLSLLSSSPRSFNINGPAPKAPQFRHNLYIMTLCFCHSILLDWLSPLWHPSRRCSRLCPWI